MMTTILAELQASVHQVNFHRFFIQKSHQEFLK